MSQISDFLSDDDDDGDDNGKDYQNKNNKDNHGNKLLQILCTFKMHKHSKMFKTILLVKES